MIITQFQADGTQVPNEILRAEYDSAAAASQSGMNTPRVPAGVPTVHMGTPDREGKRKGGGDDDDDEGSSGTMFPTIPATYHDQEAWNVARGLIINPNSAKARPLPKARPGVFHTQTHRYNGRPAFLLDTGSWGNLNGDEWAQIQAERALKNGRSPKEIPRDRPLNVSGVGKQGEACHHNVELPSVIESTKKSGKSYIKATYSSPTAPRSPLPALWGLNSCQENRMIIDCIHDKGFLCGPGEFDLEELLPTGTEVLEFGIAPSGHYLVPCDYFEEFDKQERLGGMRIERQLNLHATQPSQASTDTIDTTGMPQIFAPRSRTPSPVRQSTFPYNTPTSDMKLGQDQSP